MQFLFVIVIPELCHIFRWFISGH